MQRLKNAQECHVVKAGVGTSGTKPKEGGLGTCGEGATSLYWPKPDAAGTKVQTSAFCLLPLSVHGFWRLQRRLYL